MGVLGALPDSGAPVSDELMRGWGLSQGVGSFPSSLLLSLPHPECSGEWGAAPVMGGGECRLRVPCLGVVTVGAGLPTEGGAQLHTGSFLPLAACSPLSATSHPSPQPRDAPPHSWPVLAPSSFLSASPSPLLFRWP